MLMVGQQRCSAGTLLLFTQVVPPGNVPTRSQLWLPGTEAGRGRLATLL